MSEALDARQRMIEVAERLFAEQGVGAVSLRTVGQHAGQRNNSAAQYHFGSKQGLVDAIVALRSVPIEQRRAALIADLADQQPDVRSLVRVLVYPLAESVRRSGPRTHYLRFLANAMDDYSLADSWRVSQVQPPSFRATVRQLRWMLPSLSSQVFERRMRWVARVSLRLLADHEQELAIRPETAASTGEVLADLVEMMVALLEAPQRPAELQPD